MVGTHLGSLRLPVDPVVFVDALTRAVAGQRGDAFWIEGLPEQGRMFGLAAAESFTPDRWLEQGDTVQVGECELQVLHCPGHTPVHVIFFHREGRFAQVPRHTLSSSVRLQELTVAAGFAEVFLAKEGHDGLVGINFLRKIELPLPATLYGALLAGVDFVLVGAGSPADIPASASVSA